MTHDELIAGMQSSDPALRAQVQIVLDALSEAADALLAAFRQAHDGRAPETERELRAWWFAQPHGGQYAEWIQDWIAMEAMQASVYEDMTAEVKAGERVRRSIDREPGLTEQLPGDAGPQHAVERLDDVALRKPDLGAKGEAIG